MIYFNKLIDICINCYESQKVVDNYFDGTNDISVRTNRTDKYNIILKRMIFFCCKKLLLRRVSSCVSMTFGER